jgi:tetratricopeptide (TPR) repeat protein
MKNILLISIALLLIFPPDAKACLNEMGTNRQGQQIELYQFYSIENWKQDLELPFQEDPKFPEYGKSVIENIKENPSVKNKNSLAVYLVYLGKYQEAIALLNHIEKIKPGEYRTASNMGTAYELLGDNVEALQWIKEGIRRNTDSHFGSEWLHVRILEAKIAEKQGRPVPRRGSILELDFGQNLVPVVPKVLPLGNDGKQVSSFNLANSITYQLNERTNFVRPNEQIVAGLFFDLGNLEFAAGSIEKAEVAYEFALRYGYPVEKIINLRRNEIARILASTKGKKLPVGKCETCSPPPPPPKKNRS